MNKYLTLLPVLLILTACGMRIAKPSKTTVLAPPDSLLINCTIDKPPPATATDELVKAWISQTINLANCNITKEELRQWKSRALKASGAGS